MTALRSNVVELPSSGYGNPRFVPVETNKVGVRLGSAIHIWDPAGGKCIGKSSARISSFKPMFSGDAAVYSASEVRELLRTGPRQVDEMLLVYPKTSMPGFESPIRRQQAEPERRGLWPAPTNTALEQVVYGKVDADELHTAADERIKAFRAAAEERRKQREATNAAPMRR